MKPFEVPSGTSNDDCDSKKDFKVQSAARVKHLDPWSGEPCSLVSATRPITQRTILDSISYCLCDERNYAHHAESDERAVWFSLFELHDDNAIIMDRSESYQSNIEVDNAAALKSGTASNERTSNNSR